MSQAKKLLITALLVFYGGVAAVCIANVSLDPFYYYKAPPENALFSNNGRYQNPGLLRHLDYDTIIVGTSRSANFRPDMFKDSDWQVLKTTTNGSSSYLHKLTILRAIEAGKVKRILLELPYRSYSNGEKWTNRNSIPEYLYQPSPITPFYHLLTLDNICPACVNKHTIMRNVMPRPLEDLDEWYHFHKGKFGSAVFAGRLNKIPSLCQPNPEKDAKLKLSPNVLKEQTIAALDNNLLKIVKDNPQIEFIGFFPPIANLKDYRKPNSHHRRKSFRRYIIEHAQSLPNLRLYDFAIIEQIVNDMSRSKDFNHFDIDAQQLMATQIQRNDSRYFIDDYQQYLQRDPLTKIVEQFDITQFHACGGDKAQYTLAEMRKMFSQSYNFIKRNYNKDPVQAEIELTKLQQTLSLYGDSRWMIRLARIYLNGWVKNYGPKDALAILNDDAFAYFPEGIYWRGKALAAIGDEDSVKKGEYLIELATDYGYKPKVL